MRREGFPGAGDFLADLFKLAADFFDLGKGGVGGGCLGFEGSQRLLGFLNLTLQGVILLLGDFTFLQLLVCLLRRRFQGGQFFLGLFDGVAQQPLLLGHQFCVRGIELQQLLNVLQLRLRAFDFLVDALQRRGQFRSIAADLNGNAFQIRQ